MISVNTRGKLVEELMALGGTKDQVGIIGGILYTVAALSASSDAEYLIENIKTQQDPLVVKACKAMLDALIQE